MGSVNVDHEDVLSGLAKEKGQDDEEEETKHRCLRFLFHLGCL